MLGLGLGIISKIGSKELRILEIKKFIDLFPKTRQISDKEVEILYDYIMGNFSGEKSHKITEDLVYMLQNHYDKTEKEAYDIIGNLHKTIRK